MPGISVVVSTVSDLQKKLESSRGELAWKDGYTVKEMIRGENTSVVFSQYDGYPGSVYEDDHAFIIVEGLIYNKAESAIRSELVSVAADFIDNRDYKKSIRDFIDTSDGEYLVLIYLKESGDFVVFNDRWARLPVFYSIQDDRFVLSRELKFILHWLPEIRLDRNWMTEFLVFEYNLGDKSLIKGVRSMKPSLLLHASVTDGAVRTDIEQLHPANFDCEQSGLPRQDILKKCAELFMESLECRVKKIQGNGCGIVADLSGGHDSRAVFAALCNLGVEFLACNDNLTEGDEAEIARQVARLYGRNLVHFDTEYPVDDLRQMQKVTYATDGLVNCLTSLKCYYDDLERERSINGRQSHFMGLGGEFLRHRYRPIRHYRTLADMVRGDGFTNLFRIKDACRITDVDISEFHDNLENEIDRYPERSTVGKVVHLNFERYNKFDNGGENRHRLFSWVVSPFWAKDLFHFVTTKIPPNEIDYIFFADFLRVLDPRTWEVPLYAGIMGINPLKSFSSFNLKVRLKKALRGNRYLYSAARYLANRRRKSDTGIKEAARIADQIRDLTAESRAVSSFLEPGRVNELISPYPRSLPFYQLLTLALYINEIERRFGDRINIDG